MGIKSMKGTCGQEKWKGDKNCDDENNNAGCNWDGGDCCGPHGYAYCKECKCLDCTFVSKGDECVKAIKSACGAANYVGDKYCDDNNNNAGCNWDKGDCCGPANNYKYCKKCKCKDCTYVKKGDKCIDDFKNGCGAPKFKGDGDCCGDKANIKYCKLCECRDCTKAKQKDCPGKSKGCALPNYKKDGNCDDENNNCKCDWDGGDCC